MQRLTQIPFPPYTYVPGKAPHPIRDPDGHRFGKPEPHVAHFDPAAWRECEPFLHGVELFNAGFFWEAHEQWEAVWNAVGRAGVVADLLKGLIKLAAAGVKRLEGRPVGVTRHLNRANELFDLVAQSEDALCGLSLSKLKVLAADFQQSDNPQISLELKVSTKRFYPTEAPLPEELVGDHFTLRPLTPAHVELDYAAVMSNKEMLRVWAGNQPENWPRDEFTLEENLADLKRHDEEHVARDAFTYTMLSRNEDEVIGCLYIVPFDDQLMRENPHLESLVGDNEAMAGFWVVESRLADRLELELLGELRRWFDEAWEFKSVYFHTCRDHLQQIETFEANGLRRIESVRRPNRGEFLLFQ